MKQEKNFINYKLIYESEQQGQDLKIINVLDTTNKTVKFSHSFYKQNKEYLDTFYNIEDWVKEKKEKQEKTKNELIINLDNKTLEYKGTKEEKQQAMRVAYRLLQTFILSNDTEAINLHNEIKKNKNQLKELKSLFNDGIDCLKEIEKLENLNNSLKVKLNKILL